MNPSDYLSLRPDTPQWMDLRGFLFSGKSAVFANPVARSGFIVRPRDLPVAVAAGQPERTTIEAATDTSSAGAGDAGEWHLLAPPESVPAVADALPRWTRRDVTLHTRARSSLAPPTPAGIEIVLAPGGWPAAGFDIDHLPPALRDEYRSEFVRSRPMAAAIDGDRPVAFCYSAVSTESWWDVAVDTLDSHRRRGLASCCFAALAAHLEREGRAPVWGALNQNTASMRLAERLAFRPTARLVSFVRPLASDQKP